MNNDSEGREFQRSIWFAVKACGLLALFMYMLVVVQRDLGWKLPF